ncbi:hypothetical protein FRB90_002869 [Tulasnella sp. 427]|nr:hypothetical protein FRB90_002869 [Tulasnella sp. 427]
MSTRSSENASNRVWDVVKDYWDLGFTAFGGPPAHFQILHERFVDKARWVTEKQYQELFALTQALSGPASTKLGFCIALEHAGFLGAVVGFLLWSLPGAVAMYAFSLGVGSIGDSLPTIVYALLSGLNASTVGIVAVAAVQLSERSITDSSSRAIILFSAGAGMMYKALWYFPLLMVVSGLFTCWWDVGGGQGFVKRAGRWWEKVRNAFSLGWRERTAGPLQQEGQGASGDRASEIELSDIRGEFKRGASPTYDLPTVPDPTATSSIVQRSVQRSGSASPSIVPSAAPQHSATALTNSSSSSAANVPIRITTGLAILIAFFASFITLLVLRGALHHTRLLLKLFTNMYLAGAIIFGGGPVVIPLLREYVVTEGWVSSRDFLLGLAVIQALPGPNFNFSVYLASLTAKNAGLPTAAGALLGWVAIFLPGLALATAASSLFPLIRKYKPITSLLRGVNLGAVGLVWTAVYRLWEIGYLTPSSTSGTSLGLEPWWVVVALVAFSGNRWFKVPAPVCIVLGGVMGIARNNAKTSLNERKKWFQSLHLPTCRLNHNLPLIQARPPPLRVAVRTINHLRSNLHPISIVTTTIVIITPNRNGRVLKSK